ncbi:sulfatase-like hydrolase/transferase [Hydrogenimonas urashimensis]|uniref:sulfatase-like hydrolase/transferase n=1 Tax=Hydrogenimonas urashimensis TaxID=2740515 RepID=UPI0019151F08|nr:sulfatase-like hydrolase/transferase [Hydrogenimonas urashimensis]
MFFVFILFVTCFFRRGTILYPALLLLGYLHHLFFTFFQREVSAADIRLFFGHIDETFETFFAMGHLFLRPTLLFIIGLLLVGGLRRFFSESCTLTMGRWTKRALLLVLILLSADATLGMKLGVATMQTLFRDNTEYLQRAQAPLYPLRESNITIVLVIGESMKYDSEVERRLKKSGNFYKKIYAGATNTDVSVPLLLNGLTDPRQLSGKNETNLFRLAKKNGYSTMFCSAQSPKSLRYIEPFLQRPFIDHYQTYAKTSCPPLYDFHLFEALESSNLTKKRFIVLQQIGQHSPYIYYPGKKSDEPLVNYHRSLSYSFMLYDAIIWYLREQNIPFVFVMTSDHGEFTGEEGRFGHNTFDPVVYEVPLMVAANVELPESLTHIVSHYHVYQLLRYLLGYEEQMTLSKKPVVVNGSMVSREDGFIVIHPRRICQRVQDP